MSAIPAAPAVAVIIPTHNRVEILRQVLDSILVQTVPAEIYVMDDASTDGTESVVRQNYPQVRYHREDKSKGPTFQRNKAAAMTRASVLVTIDDDCVLNSPQTLQQALEAFDHPRVAGVTLPFINVLKDSVVRTAAPKDGSILATLDYFGGMVALRRDVYLGVGGYRTFYMIQVEEPDLCIRMMQAGYIVRLGWSEPLKHLESPLRDTPRRDRQGARNHLLYLHYNVPWPYYPFRVAGTSLALFIHGIKYRVPMRVLRGIFAGYGAMAHEISARKPVSSAVYHLSTLLRRRHGVPLQEIESMLPPMKPFSPDGNPT
jgi:glycosyltransferase involved in cell wall biosynthesis